MGHHAPGTGREEEKKKAELKVMNNYYLIMPSVCAIELAHSDGTLKSGFCVPYKALG